jgi:predicted TIM-barrel fold metal-dependent hydrolase
MFGDLGAVAPAGGGEQRGVGDDACGKPAFDARVRQLHPTKAGVQVAGERLDVLVRPHERLRCRVVGDHLTAPCRHGLGQDGWRARSDIYREAVVSAGIGSHHLSSNGRLSGQCSM